MSSHIESIQQSSQALDFSDFDDASSYADCSHQAADLDLNRVLLHSRDEGASTLDAVSNERASPLLNVVEGNVQKRSNIRGDIAHLNAGHSDPTMISVDIREINHKMGTLALETQVVMKVEQSGIGAVKQLLSGQ